MPIEFTAYRKKYEFGGCPQDEWEKAWLHHIHLNPHHWQHWILKFEPIPMPYTYVREMVIDWHAAAIAYKGSLDDVQLWLNENFAKMMLHWKTVAELRVVLKELGLTLPRL